MDIVLVLMSMENKTKLASLVCEGGTVSHPDQFSGFLQQGILLVFGPSTHQIGSRGATYAVEGTFITVGGISHIINSVVLDDKRTFIHTRPHFLPCLRNVNARMHGLLLDSHEVFLQFGHPNVESVVETVEKEIRCAVVINEQGVINAFLIGNLGLLLALSERTCGRIGCCHTDMLVCRIVHIELPVHFVDLRRPEPTVGPDILLLERHALILPSLQIIGGIDFNAVIRMGAVCIVSTLVQHDERVAQRYRCFNSFDNNIVHILIV